VAETYTTDYDAHNELGLASSCRETHKLLHRKHLEILLDCICDSVAHIRHANQKRISHNVTNWFREQLADLGLRTGSLSLRRTSAYESTAKHALRVNSTLAMCFTDGSRPRFAVYVPDELVPEVSRCLDNGRAVQICSTIGGTLRECTEASEKPQQMQRPVNDTRREFPIQLCRFGISRTGCTPGAHAAGHLRFR